MKNNLSHDINGHTGWIDTVKGMGVWLVVLGHFLYECSIPVLNTAIYAFHMPMFFIISGLVIKTENREGIGSYIHT